MITEGKSLPFGDSNQNKQEFRYAVVYDKPKKISRSDYFSGWPEKLIEATLDLVFQRLLVKNPEIRL